MRHRCKKEWAVAFDMWVSGKSCAEIGSAIGVTREAVRLAAKDLDWPRRELRYVLVGMGVTLQQEQVDE